MGLFFVSERREGGGREARRRGCSGRDSLCRICNPTHTIIRICNPFCWSDARQIKLLKTLRCLVQDMQEVKDERLLICYKWRMCILSR